MQIFTRKKKFIKGTTRIKGHNFTVLDPMSMPKVRQSAYHLAEYEKGWGITKENLILAFDEMKKQTSYPQSWAGNDDLISQLSDKLKDMSGILDMVSMVIKQDHQFDPIIKSACNIILLDGEDPGTIDPKIQNEKLALCQKHDEIMVFFLIVERNSNKTIEDIYNILETSGQLEIPKKEKLMEAKMISMIRRK